MLNCENVGDFEKSTKVINTTMKIIRIHFYWLRVIIVIRGGKATWTNWFQVSSSAGFDKAFSNPESPISPNVLCHGVDLPNDRNLLPIEFEPPTF